VAGAKVRWRLDDERFEVLGHGDLWFGEDGETIIGAAAVVEPAALSEMRRAIDRYRSTMYDRELDLEVYDEPAELIAEAPEFFQPRDVSLTFAHDRTLITITTAVALDEKRLDRWETTAVLYPVLSRHRATVVEFVEDRQIAATVYRMVVEISPRGRTVGHAMAIGADILHLWEAILHGGLTPATVVDLLRAQRPELLVGQPETVWFEAKQAPYRLDDPLQRIELAKDVAALTNQREGGLLVIGLATRKRRDVDVVAGVRPQPMELLSARRYRLILDRWVYPPPEELVIEAVEVEPDKGLLFILIPRQAEALHPFFVVGAISDGRLLGNHFSLVRRRGDETVATNAIAVHSLLVAGRAALATARREPSAADQSGARAAPEDSALGTVEWARTRRD
jgi:hypothetical protein